MLITIHIISLIQVEHSQIMQHAKRRFGKERIKSPPLDHSFIHHFPQHIKNKKK